MSHWHEWVARRVVWEEFRDEIWYKHCRHCGAVLF